MTASRRRRSRDRSLAPEVRRLVAAAACLAIVVLACICATYAGRWSEAIALRAHPERAALRRALAKPGLGELDRGYAARGYRPLWLLNGRPTAAAEAFLRRLSESASDDLDPARYGLKGLSARLAAAPDASPAERARTDLLTTATFVRFVSDLHTPSPSIPVAYADPALRAPARPTTAEVFEVFSKASSPTQAVAMATRMNPLYVLYHQAIARDLAGRDGDGRRLLLLNLERARALPIDLGRRFILVDAASARLWMYENGRPVDTMKVVVGKPDEATPMLAGVIRYAMFNPRWNVPPDLVRSVYAPRIQAHPAVLAALQMDPWSDYSPNAHRLDPATVDWAQVEAGATTVALRQRPGPQNYMGAVKFMLPNELGIYLHDTPEKALFSRPRRTFSSGCVRVEDYQRLARWLYMGAPVGRRGDAPDQRFDLKSPVPVYITYLTAWPEAAGVATTTDVYGRDRALLAQLQPAGGLKPM